MKNADTPIILIAHDVRSAHNVGSLLRTADAFGVSQVILTGYTPYPRHNDDTRLPHIADKLTRQISKTALGAEETVPCTHYSTLSEALSSVRQLKPHIYALEQAPSAAMLDKTTFSFPAVLVVGNEVSGLSADELTLMDGIVEIPMHGQKESLNVSVAAGIALYHMKLATQS